MARPFLEMGVAPDHSLVTRQRRPGASRVAYFLHYQYCQSVREEYVSTVSPGLAEFLGCGAGGSETRRSEARRHG